MRFHALPLFAVVLSVAAHAAPPLPALGVQAGHVTVSGVSSGGFMAVQFHVAHSTLVDGAGVLAGGPYECAEGSVWQAQSNCMAPDAGHPVPSTAVSLARIDEDAAAGRIDPPAGLVGDRVWLLAGGQDRTVDRSVVDALDAFYRHWLAADQLAYVTVPDAGHAMLSLDDPQANACASTEPPYINRCEGVDAAGQLLAHLLGPLQPKAPRAAGQLLAFDQHPFAEAADSAGLGATAYVYIPTGCRAGGCRVHVAFHGCRQSADQIGERFVTGAGYNRWAEANRLVVLYPQTTPRYGWARSGLWPRWVFNPRACWDWWGYESVDYATRKGPQILAVKAMLDRLAAPASGRP
ncbi:extracellular catalytic domain type 2 short-chain-length polyhydroxyalkanoate depolymerase [Denitromonas iodatirespirans]|uniref:Poly(3-hydroxybutyrate) depolymerase n=1 Tax=Denitromonas iodatirespirans TaxID=2795389 RepID=A0A944DD28_DENI1|nr:PHB depolymerase family esterase [Denitromonas iodatirespirans]MBT0962117.1 poly(3-hydroxybutyrate) depolymerase [Denitromonas iodatirespirans]